MFMLTIWNLSFLKKYRSKLLEQKKFVNISISNRQFCFKQEHASIEKINQVVMKIRTDIEDRKLCTTGLLCKLRTVLPFPNSPILQFYLTDRKFPVNSHKELTPKYKIGARIPQRSSLGPVLYVLYLPKRDRSLVATYANDVMILPSHKNNNLASQILQNHLLKIEHWLNKWRLRTKETRSVQVT